MVIHVIAEQATLTGAGDAPAMMPGHEGLIPAEMIAQLARDARIGRLFHPGAAAPETLPTLAGVGGVRAVPRCDVPLPRL